MDITEQLTHESRIALAAAAEITRLRAEVERLTAVVKAANAQAEHFERQWYLRGDEVEALRADAQAVAALLPGPYYMDPPDGGSVTVIEQLRRMAADAARYRWLRHHSTYTTVTPCIHGEVAGPSRMRWYHDSYQLQAFTLDAAIDAARAAQGDKT
jgi:anti-sigma factor ChrR (cupin superfamily)